MDAPQMSDGKDADALRTIGEVARALGIAAHVLRYWERQFPMLRPMQRGGGRRYYRPADIALIRTIDRLVNHEGYTLKGAMAVLRNGSKDEASVMASGATEAQGSGSGAGVPGASKNADLDRASLLAELRAVRIRLVEALEV